MAARTLVIIPAFNEEESLPAVLATLRAGVPDFDVLVVDDGSVDRTTDVAIAAGVRVARLPFNLGIGGALRTGFRHAVQHGYDRAIQFDADGQHEVTELAPMLGDLDNGADLVVGTRFAPHPAAYRPGIIRGGAMNVLRLAVAILSGRQFSDTSSGFRAFSRPMLEYFAHTYPVEYMDSVEALLLACYAGFTVIERPVVMHERSAGRPSTRNLKLVYHYMRLIVVLFAMASLRQRRGARAT